MRLEELEDIEYIAQEVKARKLVYCIEQAREIVKLVFEIKKELAKKQWEAICGRLANK